MVTSDPFAPVKQIQQLAHIADAASAKIFGFIVKSD